VVKQSNARVHVDLTDGAYRTIQGDAEPCIDDGNIVLPSPRLLVGFHVLVVVGIRDGDRSDDFIVLDIDLAVGRQEEITRRNDTLPFCRLESELGIQGHEDGVEIRDGRCCDNVASEAGTIPNGSAGEPLQLMSDRREASR